MIEKVIKRDGTSVPFDAKKIETAIKKAFYNQGYSETDIFEYLCTLVVAQLVEKEYTVEQIQDYVVQTIKREGYDDVERAYSAYRANQIRMREAKVLNKIDNHSLIVKDSKEGIGHIFDKEALHNRFEKVAKGLEYVNVRELLELVCKGLYDGITQKELEHLILKESEYKMEEHHEYGNFGGRMVIDQLYKDVLNCSFLTMDKLKERYSSLFPAYVNRGVNEKLLDTRMLKYDLDVLGKAINPDCDLLFSFFGVQVLADRYLLKNRSENEDEKKIFELPQWLWMRVAMGLALNEEDKEKRAIEFYNVLSNLYLVNSTPTLFNSGTRFMQLSSCYINIVDDSLSGIFKTFGDIGQLSKWAGGIGTDWTGVRSSGSVINGTNGVSSGIIPFLKVFNDIAIAVNQGGKRRGAMAGYLENWHIDIEEFLVLKKNTGDERRRAHDIHPAVFVSDLFMKRVKEDGDWMLFSPDSAKGLHNTYGKEFEDNYLKLEKNPPFNHKVVSAKEMWRQILTMLYETGHPWITFKDAINVRSPQDHQGMVHSSNLCTEITLNTSQDETAVCNLASINLERMVRDGKLDEKLIESTITTGIRMLDNVIDLNFYPTTEARNANMLHRPIGLGMMGYHDALFKLEIPYCSDEQVEFADKTMEMVSYYAILSSSKIAKEKGTYATYPGSKWNRGIFPLDTLDLLEESRGEAIKVNRKSCMDWSDVRNHVLKYGMRNSNCMAIAPTATIANIAGVVPCVEPIYKNIYMKENLSGNFFIINKYLIDRMLKLNLWNRDIITKIKLADGSVMGIEGIPMAIKEEFREVFEIDQRWVIKSASVRSKWIDQSASTNLFINTRSGKELSDLYFLVWESGIKTTYYLRTFAVSQITKTVGEGESEGPVELKKPTPKACSLTNPDCEACQ